MTIARQPSGPSGIFISYRREQTGILVDRLHDRLATHFGPEQVLRDIEKIDPLDDFGQRIDKVVGSCSAFVAVMSDRWLQNRNPAVKRPIGVPRDWVQREVETALRKPAMLVVPVLVEGAAMPGELELPFSISSLARRNTLGLSDASWDSDVERLIEVLEEVVPRGGRPALPASPDGAPAGADGPPPAAAPRTGRWFRRR